MSTICFICGSSEETRPYGKGGGLICFECAFTPENSEITKSNFNIQLSGAISASDDGIIVLGESTGPRPINPRRLN